jgi:hypothetical protein
MAINAGLEYVGSKNYEIDDEVTIKGDYGGLRCYTALLRKKIAPSETKVAEPKETKEG